MDPEILWDLYIGDDSGTVPNMGLGLRKDAGMKERPPDVKQIPWVFI